MSFFGAEYHFVTWYEMFNTAFQIADHAMGRIFEYDPVALKNVVIQNTSWKVHILRQMTLPWVRHTWMLGTNPLQTPRAWFWKTHKWAVSAALLGGRVSRIAGDILVFGPLLHRGIELRSLCQSSWGGYSVCIGLFLGKRWWSVGDVAADGVRPGLVCILQFCCGRWLSVLLWIRVLSSL